MKNLPCPLTLAFKLLLLSLLLLLLLLSLLLLLLRLDTTLMTVVASTRLKVKKELTEKQLSEPKSRTLESNSERADAEIAPTGLGISSEMMFR